MRLEDLQAQLQTQNVYPRDSTKSTASHLAAGADAIDAALRSGDRNELRKAVVHAKLLIGWTAKFADYSDQDATQLATALSGILRRPHVCQRKLRATLAALIYQLETQ